MNIFDLWRRRKRLQGRICNEISGIYIDLPAGWEAFKIDSITFAMGKNGSKQANFVFTVTDFPLLKVGKEINPFTGEKVEVTRVQEGEFETFDIPLGEKDLYARIWTTDIDKYFIRFIYICAKKDLEQETDAVRKIVNSLVKYPVEENSVS